MASVCLRVVIKGKVQGVSFRSSMSYVAARNRVDGWVRNNLNGSVEALLQGDDRDVDEVVSWARQGPRGAIVEAVTTERLRPSPHLKGFHIVP